MKSITLLAVALGLLAACSGPDHLETTTVLTPNSGSAEYVAMMSPGLPKYGEQRLAATGASLWDGGRQSLLGDRRAVARGDILTIVIEIDDKAEISNSSSTSRSGSESLQIPSFFGIPERVNAISPDGGSLASAVDLDSSSSAGGDGAIRRKEKLTLRVAATIVGILPNGVLQIEGSQEVRVNYELRELLVSGFIRPADISRQNEVTYDKIAAARISYGGRGQISEVQKPRFGQQVLDQVLPF